MRTPRNFAALAGALPLSLLAGYPGEEDPRCIRWRHGSRRRKEAVPETGSHAVEIAGGASALLRCGDPARRYLRRVQRCYLPRGSAARGDQANTLYQRHEDATGAPMGGSPRLRPAPHGVEPPPCSRGAIERTMDAMCGCTDCLAGSRVKGAAGGSGVYRKGEVLHARAFR